MIRLLVIVLCFFSSLGFSQTGFLTTPQVISTVGGNWIQNNYNLSFTVGEIAVVTHIEQSTILTQGFHQENYQVVNLSELSSNYKVTVFPNPTQDHLNISFDLPNNIATIRITDVKGKTLYIKPDILTDEDQKVDLVSLSQGVYWLEIILEKTEKIVYQIQKIN